MISHQNRKLCMTVVVVIFVIEHCSILKGMDYASGETEFNLFGSAEKQASPKLLPLCRRDLSSDISSYSRFLLWTQLFQSVVMKKTIKSGYL